MTITNRAGADLLRRNALLVATIGTGDSWPSDYLALDEDQWCHYPRPSPRFRLLLTGSSLSIWRRSTIARRLALNALRSWQRRPDGLPDLATPGPGPEQPVESAEVVQGLLGALSARLRRR